MPDIIASEIPNAHEYRKVPPREIRTWLETGKRNATLIYGTGMRQLDIITRTGEIPSHNIEFPYQKEITKEEKHLYYFFPLLPALQKAHPQFAHSYIESMNENFVHEKNYSEEDLESAAKFYARRQVWEDGFQKATNVRTRWIFLLWAAKRLLPGYIQSDTQLISDSNIDIYQDTEVTKLIDQVGENTIKQTLPDILRRRGFLLYFNASTFQIPGGTMYLGHEAETEVMMTTKQPLLSRNVSGLIPLSQYDRDDLYGLSP